jgi:protein phosphatase
MKLRYAGKTDVGMKRKHNEDNFLLLPEQDLFVVADGMGGHNAGEVASAMAVETIASFFHESAGDPEYTWPVKSDPSQTETVNRLVAAVKLANLRIYESQAADIQKKGMGTTVVAIVRDDQRVITAHAGDSRAYMLRNGELSQVTEDHSLLNNYKKIAKLTEEEISNFPHKNVIVRALGMKADVEVDTNEVRLAPGDSFLLCSDGLSGEVPDPDICRIVNEAGDDLDAAVDRLIKTACENGGKDNVTVILLRCVEA